jgi:hypothetical protein
MPRAVTKCLAQVFSLELLFKSTNLVRQPMKHRRTRLWLICGIKNPFFLAKLSCSFSFAVSWEVLGWLETGWKSVGFDFLKSTPEGIASRIAEFLWQIENAKRKLVIQVNTAKVWVCDSETYWGIWLFTLVFTYELCETKPAPSKTPQAIDGSSKPASSKTLVKILDSESGQRLSNQWWSRRTNWAEIRHSRLIKESTFWALLITKLCGWELTV